MKYVIQQKKSYATISLPKKSRSASSGTAKRSTAATRTTRVRLANANSAAAKTKTRRNTGAQAAKPVAKPQGAFQISNIQRLAFVSLIVALVAICLVYVSSVVHDRRTRFKITELMRQEQSLHLQQEKLQNQITTYLKPELIIRNAEKRGMRRPSSSDITKLK